MSSNKTIAKNTIFLYFRLLFTLGIGLFTSRVVLQILGIEDFGIYNVVGGLVAIFAFLQSSLSGASVRFLNVGMVGNKEKLKIIFNTALILHFVLALVILLLAETVGLWFFYNKLNVPNNIRNTAFWVYQISVISIIFSVIQIPYNAAIIAHEKMNIYAYLSILEAILKLLIIYIVGLFSYNRLLYYSILILLLSIIIRLVYQVYCRVNFYECKFSFLFDKDIFKKMMHFFGWDLYGNMSYALNLQGFSIIQNIFFGPIINASIAIVTQLQGGISSLGNNFTLAVKPQIIQSFVKDDYDRMNILLNNVTKLSFSLMLIIALPLSFNTDYILKLWLGELPVYSNIFLKISLLSAILNVTFSILVPIIHATGKVFLISFLTGSIYLLNLPATYLLLYMGFDPTIPYYSSFVISILAGISNIYIINRYIPKLNIYHFCKKTLLPLGIVYLLLFIFFSIFTIYVVGIHSILKILIFVIFTTLILYVLILNKEEKEIINRLIIKKIEKLWIK